MKPAGLIVRGAMLSLLAASNAGAADHFLTIGGGESQSTNQVSLEKNVLYFQEALRLCGQAESPHNIFFADGNDPGRDLEVEDPNHPPPRVNVLLARIFGQEDGVDTQYRSSQIPGTSGAAKRTDLDAWFRRAAPNWKAGDRLFIYVTGHGGRQGNSASFTLWNESPMSVRQWVDRLDEIPPQVQVVLVMVQCYCEAFADVIFKRGDSHNGLSDQRRCGFFATAPDREAAGCTADTQEENYKDYSTSFWAALCGRTRTGEKVVPPDFDGDGRVSLTEAHAYALIHCDTIDLPMKTSEEFLRVLSRAGTGDLWTADVPFERLLGAAPPANRAVLTQIAGQLKLTGEDCVSAARRTAADIEKQRKLLAQRRKRWQTACDKDGQQIAQAVTLRWPELSNPWNPNAPAIIAEHAKEIVSAIESHSQFEDFQDLYNRLQDLDDQDLELERKWARCHRLIFTAETVALEANLPRVCTPEVREKYRALVEEENQSLGSGHRE